MIIHIWAKSQPSFDFWDGRQMTEDLSMQKRQSIKILSLRIN
jgi:hypothetical protein